jgi:hypothetical protein
MKLAMSIAAFAAFLAVYIVWVRPYLKSLPQFADVWHRQQSAWMAVKVWMQGRKTIMAGIWGSIIGLAPDLLQIVSGVDLKTAIGLPDNWALLISGLLVPILMLIFRTKA